MKPSHAYLMIKPTSASFLITKLDHKPSIKGITVNYLSKKWEEKFGDNNIKTIGINKELLSVQYQEKIKKLYPKAKFVDVSKQLKLLRCHKTEGEVFCL